MSNAVERRGFTVTQVVGCNITELTKLLELFLKIRFSDVKMSRVRIVISISQIANIQMEFSKFIWFDVYSVHIFCCHFAAFCLWLFFFQCSNSNWMVAISNLQCRQTFNPFRFVPLINIVHKLIPITSLFLRPFDGLFCSFCLKIQFRTETGMRVCVINRCSNIRFVWASRNNAILYLMD